MKGRYRIIDEHELATLIRKAGKNAWYESLNLSAIKSALKNSIDGKTYHQFASSNDDILVNKYNVVPEEWLSINNTLLDEWKDLKVEHPEYGEEVLFIIPNITSEDNPHGHYIGSYFPKEDDKNALIVYADWSSEWGYKSRHLEEKDFKNIKWKRLKI